jgi:hypothetical protein
MLAEPLLDEPRVLEVDVAGHDQARVVRRVVGLEELHHVLVEVAADRSSIEPIVGQLYGWPLG